MLSLLKIKNNTRNLESVYTMMEKESLDKKSAEGLLKQSEIVESNSRKRR